MCIRDRPSAAVWARAREIGLPSSLLLQEVAVGLVGDHRDPREALCACRELQDRVCELVEALARVLRAPVFVQLEPARRHAHIRERIFDHPRQALRVLHAAGDPALANFLLVRLPQQHVAQHGGTRDASKK
eukprot:1762771-Rhodomonas_salina.1